MTHILRMLIFALRRKGSSAVAVPFASALRPILQCCAAERPLATRDAGALPWRSQSQDIPPVRLPGNLSSHSVVGPGT